MQGPADDDVLDVAPRRHLPRWAVLALVLAVAGAGVAVLLTRGSGPTRKEAAPRVSSPAGPIRQLGGIDDMVILGGSLYRLANGALYQDDIEGDQLTPDGVLTLQGVDLTQAGVTYHLVPDPAGRWLYVVSFGDSPATVIQIDVRRMTQANLLYWPSPVSSAAVLDGSLYVVATNAVAAFAPWAREGRQVDGLPGQYQDVAADPARHRLLLFGFENDQQRFVAYTPATGAGTRAAAPFGKGRLSVVAGQIWAGGYGNAGAVLDRLDPATLRAVASSPLAPQLSPGAWPVGTGARDFWVRSGAGGNGLWCVDGRTGDELQVWHYDGPVASVAGVAYLGSSGGAVRLDLHGCTG